MTVDISLKSLNELLAMMIGEKIKAIYHDPELDEFYLKTEDGQTLIIDIVYQTRPGSVCPRGEDDIAKLHFLTELRR